jgi:hypothetical protein
MLTGCTNNHIFQIFFVFAAPMDWWDWLAAPVLILVYKGIVMLAAPALINRSMTYYWVEVSGKGNIIIPRWQSNKK